MKSVRNESNLNFAAVELLLKFFKENSQKIEHHLNMGAFASEVHRAVPVSEIRDVLSAELACGTTACMVGWGALIPELAPIDSDYSWTDYANRVYFNNGKSSYGGLCLMDDFDGEVFEFLFGDNHPDNTMAAISRMEHIIEHDDIETYRFGL